MSLDLLLLALFALFAARGYQAGTLNQLRNWAGLALARAGAKPLALVLTLALAPDLGFPAASLRVAMAVLCFLTLAVIGNILAKHLLKGSLGSHAMKRPDRTGGLLLGLGKGIVVGYILVSLALYFERPLSLVSPGAGASLDGSLSARLVRPRSFFATASAAELSVIENLMDAARQPGSVPMEDARLKSLLGDSTIAASLNDEALAQAIKTRDWAALESDPRISALLSDPRIANPVGDPLNAADK